MVEPGESGTRQPERHEHGPDDADGDREYSAWRDGLPSFELDGETLYLPTGDIPMDEKQVAEMWTRLKARRRPGDADADAD